MVLLLGYSKNYWGFQGYSPFHRSISDLSVEEEIKVQHIRPIGGNTLPPQYSREISTYQPSDKEKAKAMKDALSAVRQFTSEGNLSKNGNLNTTTMRDVGL